MSKALIDDRLYSVTTINGYRRGNLTRKEAFAQARKLFEQMQNAGWCGKVSIHYRDGSLVETLKDVDHG